MSDKTGGTDFIAGFVIGMLAGAAAALLFAPKSGEETRGLIRDKGIELKEQADEKSAEARKRAEELQAEARRKAQELQEQAKGRAAHLQGQVKQAVEEGKTAAAKTKEELLTRLDEVQASETATAEA